MRGGRDLSADGMTDWGGEYLEISVQNSKAGVEHRAGQDMLVSPPLLSAQPASSPAGTGENTRLQPRLSSRTRHGSQRLSLQGPPPLPGSQGPPLLISATALSLLPSFAHALLSHRSPLPFRLCTWSYLSLNTWPQPPGFGRYSRLLQPSLLHPPSDLAQYTIWHTPSALRSHCLVGFCLDRWVLKVKARPPLIPWALGQAKARAGQVRTAQIAGRGGQE